MVSGYVPGYVLKPKNDTHKKWLYIMEFVNKYKKHSNDQVKGIGVLVNTYFRNAYPVFENQEDGTVLLKLYYSKKDKYLQQTVAKQDKIIQFLNTITKKQFKIQSFLFEEGEEKSIYDEMDKEIDIAPVVKKLEEEKKQEQLNRKEEERKRKQEEQERLKQQLLEREQKQKEEFVKKLKKEGADKIIDPFGDGFLVEKKQTKPALPQSQKPQQQLLVDYKYLNKKGTLDIEEDDLSF